jgi:hypothetical protein
VAYCKVLFWKSLGETEESHVPQQLALVLRSESEIVLMLSTPMFCVYNIHDIFVTYAMLCYIMLCELF